MYELIFLLYGLGAIFVQLLESIVMEIYSKLIFIRVLKIYAGTWLGKSPKSMQNGRLEVLSILDTISD